MALGVVRAQVLVEFVHHIVILLIELVLLLERNMTYGIILRNEVLHLLLEAFAWVLCQFLELCDEFTLLVKISVLLVSGTGILLVASLEELVASVQEILPELVALFARYEAHGLPLSLKLNQLVAGLLPLGAFRQSLCLLYEFLLLCQVVGILALDSLEEFSLLAEELVVGDAETLKDLHVHLLRSETNLLPFALHLNHSLGSFLPVGSLLVLLLVDGLNLLAEGSLLGEVLLFLGTQVLKVLLVLLVNHGAGILESGPDFLAQILSHRTNLTILLVQVLQLVEGRDYVWFLSQFLGSLAQLGLRLQVFLEVVFASLVVEFQEVVELLHVELVVLPHLVGLLSRNSLYLFPLLLQGLEFLI